MTPSYCISAASGSERYAGHGIGSVMPEGRSTPAARNRRVAEAMPELSRPFACGSPSRATAADGVDRLREACTALPATGFTELVVREPRKV